MYTLADLHYQAQRRTQEELLVHLKSFSLDITLSVGIWYFAPGGGRFQDRYVPDLSIPQRLELAAEMARYGVKGIEAHYPSEVNEENLHLYKSPRAMIATLREKLLGPVYQLHPNLHPCYFVEKR
jgi:xylose isomerase